MISRTYTRKTLIKELDKYNKPTVIIDYPMTVFRHSIMDCASKCRGLVDCKWSFDTLDKLTICTLVFNRTEFKCSYNYIDNSVTVNKYDIVRIDDKERKLLVLTQSMDCSSLLLYITSLQPKLKVKVVRK